jgi:hypothetical protein
MSAQCVDKVVGDILAGWRYDISGITPEMRGDYEAHFDECARCRAKRKLHRTIDFALIVVTAVSAGLFVIAFAIIHRFAPRHTLILELIALAGFAFSALVWLIVAVATPVPVLAADALKAGARRVHDRLPPKVRERIPEELRVRISQ